MTEKRITLAESHKICVDALKAHNTGLGNAEVVADALVAAEADGLRGHGLSRLPSYCAQAASGKTNGQVQPVSKQVAGGALKIDARSGFAYPALALAVDELVVMTPESGISIAAVANSHHCGAAGYHVEALARKGLIGLMFANTPKAIAPWGGGQGVFGTNPIAFSVPRVNDEPLVIDLSLSKVARGKIMIAEQEGQPIPEDWALDGEGHPTTDPKAAMAGTMLPMGGAKGAALVLMVEILSAALTSAHFGFEASSFFSSEGDPPGVGQLLIAIAPNPISGNTFNNRLEILLNAILEQKNTRLPGDRRLRLRQSARQNGIIISEEQYDQLVGLGSRA
jgi:(2R)-3-sulfolactate dehydrogenase (NADP+)